VTYDTGPTTEAWTMFAVICRSADDIGPLYRLQCGQCPLKSIQTNYKYSPYNVKISRLIQQCRVITGGSTRGEGRDLPRRPPAKNCILSTETAEKG